MLLRIIKQTLLLSLVAFMSFIISCGGGGRPKPPPPCASAELCAKKYLKGNECTSNRFNKSKDYIKNNHPNKVVYFLIERYIQKMDQGWPVSDPVFQNSRMIALKGKQEYALGCIFDRNDGSDDNIWYRNIWKLRKACFSDDVNCRISTRPATPSPSPIRCIDECNDPKSDYCIKEDISKIPQISWMGRELGDLYKELEKANLANDRIDLENTSPRLFNQYCGKKFYEIKNRKFTIDGSTCDIHIPVNRTKVKDMWVRIPATANGRISVNSGDISHYFNDEHASPLLVYRIETTDTTYYEEERIERMTLNFQSLLLEGINDRCVLIEFSPYGD